MVWLALAPGRLETPRLTLSSTPSKLSPAGSEKLSVGKLAPLVTQAVPFPSVPVFPYPEPSEVLVPEASSSRQWPTKPSLMVRLLKVLLFEAKVLPTVELMSSWPPL